MFSTRSRRFSLIFILVALLLALLVALWRPMLDRYYRSRGLGDALNGYLDQRMRSGSYGQVDSLLIYHQGALVTEYYYNGYGPSDLHPVWSVTKSVTSLGYGIAYSQELPLTPLDGAVDGTDGIEIQHLLTMTAGLEWDEITSADLSDSSRMEASDDWVRFVKARAQVDPPGEVFSYNSGLTVLLADIFREDVGEPLDQFIERELFGPLGIEKYEWQKGPNGEVNGGYGLYLTPADMLKIGRLMLNSGEWEGQQLVSAEWVDQSTYPHIGGEDSWLHYGYLWWRIPLSDSMMRSIDDDVVFLANGYNEQYIVVVPSLDLVVVTTATSDRFASFLGLLEQVILPAAARSTASQS